MTVRLQTEPFDAGALLAGFAQGRTDVGAIVAFTGLARAETGDSEVATLEIDAYPRFTEGAIREMVEEAVARFGLIDALVVHRWGAIRPGEAIVFVATAARHRRAAFEAADCLMDRLKTEAPFWKKEVGPNGSSRWIEARPQDHGDAERWRMKP